MSRCSHKTLGSGLSSFERAGRDNQLDQRFSSTSEKMEAAIVRIKSSFYMMRMRLIADEIMELTFFLLLEMRELFCSLPKGMGEVVSSSVTSTLMRGWCCCCDCP